MALALYRRAAAAAPGRPAIHLAVATVAEALGDGAAMRAALPRALLLDPANAVAWVNLGSDRYRASGHAGAATAARRALAVAPLLVPARGNLGAALEALGDWAAGLRQFRLAHLLAPERPAPLIGLSRCLLELGRDREAWTVLHHAAALAPGDAGVHSNRGVVEARFDDPAAAVAADRRALVLEPARAATWCNLANLEAARDDDRALADYDRAVAAAPAVAEHQWNRALALLRHGRFPEGFQAYEWRWRWAGFGERLPEHGLPLWQGEPLDGAAVLVLPEQGLGDIIMFLRYCALVRERGGRVLLPAPPALRGLLAGCPLIDRLVEPGGPWPEPPRAMVPLLSLPRLAGSTPADVPPPTPLGLAVPAGTRPAGAPLRVGLVWGGNPDHRRDRERSLPLARLAPLAAIDGVRLVSLQHGPAAAQIAGCGFADRIDSSAALDRLDITARNMAGLDMVISVDTAPAHLAATLGIETWILLAHVTDWRWLRGGDRSIWYPSARLFRQPGRGDWPSVVASVAAALAARAAGAA